MIKTYNNHKETVHNFIWRSIQVFGKQGIIFLIFILCAKLLSPYDFGIYNYLLAIIFFVIIFSDFGISQSTSKYVAEYNTTNPNKVKNILFNSLLVIAWLSIFSIIIFVIVVYFFFNEYLQYLWYLLPLIFLAPATSAYDGVYRGLKKFKKLSLITTTVWLSSIIFVYLLINSYWLIGALIAQSLFYLVLLIALALWYREINFKIDKDLLKQITKYWVVIWFWSVGYFLYSRVDIIVLGQFWYIEEIGYYEIIDKLFVILVIPFTILAQVIAPNITALYSKNEIIQIKKKVKKYLFLLFLLGIILSIFLYFLFPILLKLFLTKYYNEIIILCFNFLLILLPFRIMGIFSWTAFITSTWKAFIITKFVLLWWLINLLCNIILIINLGYIWVFISTVIVHTFFILLTNFYFYNNLKHEIYN